ncbi:MAG: LysM peptidoglycan-binding domain-containing protein, partial [Pseudomonadota bacterium]
GSDVEVISTGQVIAVTKAGAGGDFAAVLDNPLPAGDHQLVLRVKGDETATESEEVATISVPESDPSELLVMVTKPGEASRILTKPDLAMAAESNGSEPSNTQVNQASEDTVSQSTETQVATADSGAPETNEAGSATTSEDQTSQADAGSSGGGAQATTAASDASGSEKTTETANLQTETNETAASAGITSDLRIDAVEIENGRIFVAGQAKPGGEVRVFVDGELIGSSGVSQSGRFLVEAQRELAVGDYTISAELVMQSDGSPVMRVAVPFARPAGQVVAAVAAPGSSDDQSAQSTREQGTQVAAASQNDSSGSDSGGPQITGENGQQVAAQDTDTPTVVQPALQQQDNSVIIRRGDTLWQISRRIYGQGVRYTTIYLANDHLMDHPDLIEPGQIFDVPDTPVENAEELHREHIRNRQN